MYLFSSLILEGVENLVGDSSDSGVEGDGGAEEGVDDVWVVV